MPQLAAKALNGGQHEAPEHRPVLVGEVVEALRCRPGRRFVDATVGAGGHTKAILDATRPDGQVIGFDLDPSALERAGARLGEAGDRLVLIHTDYRRIHDVLAERRTGPVDGVVADLGYSSLQVLDPARGFGFSADGPLDMRYDRSRGSSAARLLEQIDPASLRRLLREFGEERDADRIARAIIRRREHSPISTTSDLAAIVEKAAGRKRSARIHPATKTFQALRIAVNGELEGLAGFIDSAVMCLRRGGRLAVISFHSLEDRIVKRAMRALANRCVCPPRMPVCGCGQENIVRLVTARPLVPSTAELSRNPRCRSAKLRVVERT